MRQMFDLWGSGNDRRKHLHPVVRLFSGSLLVISGIIMPVTLTGSLILLFIGTTTFFLVGVPPRLLRLLFTLGIVLVLPFVLLSVFDPLHPAFPGPKEWSVAGSIALRSLWTMALIFAMVASLDLQEFHTALAAVLPSVIAGLIIQILHQSSLLLNETGRIVHVLRLRGASVHHGRRALFSFPVVWMVRMLFRAERTAVGMEMRGYSGAIPVPDRRRLTIADVLLLCGTAFVISIAIFLRSGR